VQLAKFQFPLKESYVQNTSSIKEIFIFAFSFFKILAMSTPLIQISPTGYDNLYISRKRHPFNDKRLENVRVKYEKHLVMNRTISIDSSARNNAEAASFRRFLYNDRVKIDELIYRSCKISSESIKGKRLIVYGDTTSYNLKKQIADLIDREKVGCLDDNKTPGFHVHTNVVANRSSGNILGLSDLLIWSRAQVAEGKTNSQREKIPFTDKESSKWSKGVTNSQRLLRDAAHTLYIFDSEADSYENFEHILKNEKVGFAIRSFRDRRINLNGEKKYLSQLLETSPVLGTYEINIRKLVDRFKPEKPIIRTKRTAKIELRVIEVDVNPPIRFKKSKKPIKLRLIEAREIIEKNKLLEDEEPILWKIWTTEPIEDFEQAREIIKLYNWRWNIEQLFRLTKKKGFQLESTKLTTFDAILRQTIMILKSASVVLQLLKARDNDNSQKIEDVFDEQQISVLEKLNPDLEGRTTLLKNNNPKDRLSWAAWIIARLGGWKGYNSRGRPGPITFKRGLEKFLIYVEASKVL